MTELRRSATLRLSDLLEESVTARRPLLVSATSADVERAKMEMEDQRSQLERSGVQTTAVLFDIMIQMIIRFVQSKIGREVLKQHRKEKTGETASVPIQLNSVNDITTLMEDARHLRYALLKDAVSETG